MRNSRLWRVLALLMAFSLVAAACGDDDGDTADGSDTTEATDETTEGEELEPEFDTSTLKIGTVLPETGTLAFLGPPMVNGVEMAIRDINEAGGVLEGDVTLVAGDGGTDPDVANATVDRLIGSENVNAIIGAAASGITRQIVDKVTGAGVLQCSASNTAADLRNAGNDGFYFRTAPSDDLQGPTLAEYVIDDGHANVAVLVRADEYGVGFADYVTQALEDGGATVVYNEQYDPNATNFDAEVQAIAAESPDAIVLISFEEGVQIIQGMIEAGIGPADVPLYIADGLATGDLGELIDPANPGVAEGIKGTLPSAAPESGAAFFPDAFAEFAPGVDAIYSSQAYDCAILIALAAHQAGSSDPAEIRDNMAPVSSEGTKCTTFAECKQLIDDGEDIDYDGASGPIEFDESDPGVGAYDLVEYDADGTQQVVEQVVAE
ncbi:MAG: ABC transporter substrate-binding protein [Acidimicrobiia bacterium]|nr:ABC transporter substrate-binding protein [Acidimicrobiia bacterium]